jgi:hypothetical protein
MRPPGSRRLRLPKRLATSASPAASNINQAGAIGYHFQNDALLDTTLDLEHPEVLVYEKMPDGTFQLNGVEFLVPISAWKSTEPPRIVAASPQESRFDRLLVPSLLDLEAESKRSFCPLESRRRVPGGFFDGALDEEEIRGHDIPVCFLI